jgi:hypothetical protein
MDNPANDFMKELQQRLKDFYETFSNWWMLKSILNNSYADAKGIDFAYWVFMQSFAQKQINQFADKLPEKGKEVIDAVKEAVEKVETSM